MIRKGGEGIEGKKGGEGFSGSEKRLPKIEFEEKMPSSDLMDDHGSSYREKEPISDLLND